MSKVSVLDLHDLATILLRERLLTFRKLRKARLIDIAIPPASIYPEGGEESVISYFLDEEGEGLDADAITEPINFIHPKFSNTSPKPNLSDTERIFWCCKFYDDTKSVTLAMQTVLDKLPEGSKIRIRTSSGRLLLCDARSFTINVYNLDTKTSSLISRNIQHKGKKEVNSYSFGMYEREVWANMLFYHGNDSERFILDLATPVLGVRGLGGELFALEESKDYLNHILMPSTIMEPGGSQFAKRFTSHQTEAVDDALHLADRVMARLDRIQKGQETFCAYCGKADSSKKCSNCRLASYCDSHCQKSGWKYHKRWCKEDAKSVEEAAEAMSKLSV